MPFKSPRNMAIGWRQRMAGMFGQVAVDPLLDSLISYWKMDEASGTRYDAHDGNDLTDHNTVTSNPGVISLAGQFTAANSEYLSHADNASLSVGDIDFTIACWVYLDNTVNNRIFVSQYDNGLNDRSWWVAYFNTSNRLEFRYSSNGIANASINANTLGAPAATTWYFVVAWHDAVNNTVNIQINNGGVDSAAYAAGVHNSAADFCVGVSLSMGVPTANNFMNGRIDEIGFWKRVLTVDERTRLYNGGAGLTYPFEVPPPGGRTLTTASDATLAYSASRVPHQYSCFYANGLWWAFYAIYDAAAGPFDLKFASSVDGLTWDNETTLTTIPGYDAQWTLCYDDDTGLLHIAKNIQTGGIFHDGLYYRRGTPNADGSITWDAAWQTAIAIGNFVGDFSLAVDASGYAWVAYGNASVGDAVVIKNGNLDGTWATTAGFPVALTATTDGRFAILAPLSGAGMYAAVYKYNADIQATGYYSSDGSAVFNADGNITANNVEANTGTQARVGRIDIASLRDGDIHLVYQSSAQSIYYRKRTGGAWGAETTLAGPVYVKDIVSSPRLSFDGLGNIYVMWTETTANIVYSTVYNGSSWSDITNAARDDFEDSYEHIMPSHLTNGIINLLFLHLTSDYALSAWIRKLSQL